MIGVLIYGDSDDTRPLASTLMEQPGIDVVAESGDGSEAMALEAELKPDAVLMVDNVDMPVLLTAHVTAAATLRQLVPEARLVVFGASDEHTLFAGMIVARANASSSVEGASLWESDRALAGASHPLVRFAHLLFRAFADETLGQVLADALADITEAQLVATYVVESNTGLSLAGSSGPERFDDPGVPPDLVVRASECGEPVQGEARDFADLYQRGVPASEAQAVPLFVGGELLGVLLVATFAPIRLEGSGDLVLAAAELAAAALEANRRLFESLAEARRDELTGLPNRRAFDEHVERVLAGRGGREVVLMLLDLDDFKPINDTAGHLRGDHVLRVFSRILLRSLRANEEVFRIGGDEFALVLESDANACRPIFSRLQQSLTQHGRGPRVPTVSAGASVFPSRATTRDELFKQADDALYAAKRKGKNTLVIAPGSRVTTGQSEHELPTT